MKIKNVKIVAEGPDHRYYPIRPDDINHHDMSGTFGMAEIESAASSLVFFCQARGGWYPFMLEDIYNFYKRENLNANRMFFGLMGHWFYPTKPEWMSEARPCLIQAVSGQYFFTDLFIETCAKKQSFLNPE